MNKVAVWGGGIIAMVTAILLKKNQLDVALWRPALQKIQGDNKRVFALSQTSLNLLKEFEILKNIPEDAQQVIKKMLIWDGVGHAQLELQAADISQTKLATIVEEQALWEACWKKLNEMQIPVFETPSAESCVYEKNFWVLKLAEGRQVRADFLSIADGAHSPVRQSLKVPCERGSYHQLGLVAEIEVTKPHQGHALQIFGAHGPLAFLPLAQPCRYSMVWSLDTPLAKKYAQLDEKALCEKLNIYWEGAVGEVIAVKGLKTFPLHYLHTKKYFDNHWLLLGDAAHHFHPLAGLGLNAGFADLLCLRNLFLDNPQALSAANLLAKYQRERKAKMLPLILGMKLIKNCFGITDVFWVKFRSLGMDWLNHQSLIKKVMMTLVQDL